VKLQPYQAYLEQTTIPLRLACATESGWPVVLSLWYYYQDESLYCATQAGARVVQYLAGDPRCAFEIAADQPPYCGIRGRAKAEIVPELGEDVLVKLLHRYQGGLENKLARTLLKGVASEVAIRLDPVSVHAWNFSPRMQDVSAQTKPKPCPEVF